MEQAVSHPLKAGEREKQIAKPFAEKKGVLRNDNRGLWEDSGRAGGAIYATKAA